MHSSPRGNDPQCYESDADHNPTRPGVDSLSCVRTTPLYVQPPANALLGSGTNVTKFLAQVHFIGA
jgi:hypothetical protein